MHYVKKANWQRQCDAISCWETFVLPHGWKDWQYYLPTYLSIVAGHVHPFILWLQYSVVALASFRKNNGKLVQELLEEHNNEFEGWALPPNSQDLNPIKHLWDELDKQVQFLKAPLWNLQDFLFINVNACRYNHCQAIKSFSEKCKKNASLYLLI